MDESRTTPQPDPDEGVTSDFAARSRSIRGALKRYFLRQVTDASEADDLVQDVFLKILQRGGSQGLTNFDGYVFETAANVLRDRFRRRKFRRTNHHVVFDPERHGDVEQGPHVGLEGRQALRMTTVLLMDLPERTRHVFVLRRLEGLPYREIARRLGLSVSAVEKHMVKAARHLTRRTEDLR